MKICTKAIKLVGCISAIFILSQPVFSYAESNESDVRHGQAMEFGIFFGGTATQYDTCVAKGYLSPTSPTRAEDETALYFKSSEKFTSDQEDMRFVQKGWDYAKQEIAKQNANYRNQIAEDQGIAMLLTTPGCDQDATEEAVMPRPSKKLSIARSMVECRREILNRASKHRTGNAHVLA